MKLMIRKVQYAPESEGEAPSVETTKDFLMSEKPLHVKASLDKKVCASRTQNKRVVNVLLSVHIRKSVRKSRFFQNQLHHPVQVK